MRVARPANESRLARIKNHISEPSRVLREGVFIPVAWATGVTKVTGRRIKLTIMQKRRPRWSASGSEQEGHGHSADDLPTGGFASVFGRSAADQEDRPACIVLPNQDGCLPSPRLLAADPASD